MKNKESEIKKIMSNSPTNEEEKLLCELTNYLTEVFKTFVKLNYNKINPNSFFTVIKDGSLGFCGRAILYLSNCLSDKNQIPELTNECTEIFLKYMNEIKKG